MEKFTKFTGQVIPLAIKDVDTDMIIPAQFLTQINREGYGNHLFSRLKATNPQFIFNDRRYSNASILVTQSNFGCGSSREHAVWALMQAGIKTIIAESFSDIFYNNAAKNGLLLVTLAKSEIDAIFAETEKHDIHLIVDLAQQVVKTKTGQDYHFTYDPFRKTCLLNGYDDMDYLLCAISEIREFKQCQ